jgi:hypothetical protein
VLEEQAGAAVDQQHLLDSVDQGVEEHDLGEGASGSDGREAPLDGLPGQAVLERTIEGLEHAAEARGDGLADSGAYDRKQRVGERLRVLPDRVGDGLFDGRCERARQLRIVLPQENGLGQHRADIARYPPRIADARLEGADLPLFRPDDERTQLRELGHRLRMDAPRAGGGAARRIRHPARPRRLGT